MQRVMTLLENRGYKRIGFITNQETESKAGHFWSGAFLEYQSRLIPESNHIPLLRQDSQESRFSDEDYQRIRDWYETHRPDVIISFLDNSLKYLESIGYASPQDFGYVALSWTNEMGDTSGYYQSLENVGGAAVDLVAERLYRNERGQPSHPSTTLLTGEFVEGRTLRSANG